MIEPEGVCSGWCTVDRKIGSRCRLYIAGSYDRDIKLITDSQHCHHWRKNDLAGRTPVVEPDTPPRAAPGALKV